MATSTLITAEELERMPGSDRLELVRGELREEPFHGGLHGAIHVDLGTKLYLHAEQHGLGVALMHAGFIFGRDPDTVVGPDLSFFRAERIPDRCRTATPNGCPIW